MASAAEVLEDAFDFSPVVFVWVFHTCCEEGDGCLYILSVSFAEEQELGDCVMEGLGLLFWQEFGLAFVTYCEEVVRCLGCAGCGDGLGEIGYYLLCVCDDRYLHNPDRGEVEVHAQVVVYLTLLYCDAFSVDGGKVGYELCILEGVNV